MSILVEFGISTERFELGSVIGKYESLSAELERLVPTDDRAVPYVWVSGPPETLDELTESFEANDTVSAVTVLDDLSIDGTDDRQYLYRIDWELDELDIVRGILRADGAILEGRNTSDYWTLRFRFEKHANMATFYQYLVDQDITEFNIDSVYELQSRSERGGVPELTPEQREALLLAVEQGYFEIPREVTLSDIGDRLGITQQATSERVRRGVRSVVRSSLNVE